MSENLQNKDFLINIFNPMDYRLGSTIEALKLLSEAAGASVLTVDEYRALIGYPPMESVK